MEEKSKSDNNTIYGMNTEDEITHSNAGSIDYKSW